MDKWIFAFVFQAIFGGLMYLSGYIGCLIKHKKKEDDDEDSSSEETHTIIIINK